MSSGIHICFVLFILFVFRLIVSPMFCLITTNAKNEYLLKVELDLFVAYVCINTRRQLNSK